MNPRPLLVEDRPLLLLPWLAVKIGVNEAIFLSQVHFLISLPNGGKKLGGAKWIWNTYESWKADHFPFWSVSTIKLVVRNLEKRKLLLSCQPDGVMSRKKYYRVNEAAVARLNRDRAKSVRSKGHSLHHPDRAESTPSKTETTSDTTCTETSRNVGTAAHTRGTAVPAAAEVRSYFEGHFKPEDHDAAQSWYINNKVRGWKTKSGTPIRDWKKAMTAYVKKFKPPAPSPGGDKMLEWARARGIGMDVYTEWFEYGTQHGWKRKNPITGIEEPIFDYQASLLAFAAPGGL